MAIWENKCKLPWGHHHNGTVPPSIFITPATFLGIRTSAFISDHYKETSNCCKNFYNPNTFSKIMHNWARLMWLCMHSASLFTFRSLLLDQLLDSHKLLKISGLTFVLIITALLSSTWACSFFTLLLKPVSDVRLQPIYQSQVPCSSFLWNKCHWKLQPHVTSSSGQHCVIHLQTGTFQFSQSI